MSQVHVFLTNKLMINGVGWGGLLGQNKKTNKKKEKSEKLINMQILSEGLRGAVRSWADYYTIDNL